jgi:hypothetical protein
MENSEVMSKWIVICECLGWPFCVAGIGGNTAKDLNGKPIAAAGVFVETDPFDKEKSKKENSSERYKWEDGNILAVIDDIPVRLLGSSDGTRLEYAQGYSSEKIAHFLANNIAKLKCYGITKCRIMEMRYRKEDIVDMPIDKADEVRTVSPNAPWKSKPCPVPRPSEEEWLAAMPTPEPPEEGGPAPKV